MGADATSENLVCCATFDLTALDGEVHVRTVVDSVMQERDVAFSDDGRGVCTFVDGGDERFVYLHGMPDAADRYLPPLPDGGRVSFDLRIVAPPGWTVISHCPAREQPRGGEGGEWHFVVPMPMAAESMTFVAGPWATDSTGRMAGRPSVRARLAESPVADMLDDVLALYERWLGVSHPFEQRPCVFVPGYGSQAGSSGGIFVFHERVLHASLDEQWDRYVRWVVAHEAAHPWFGSLFALRSREADRWLYEGVATYLCHRAMEELWPDSEPWSRFHVLEVAEALEFDASGHDHPSLVYAKPAALLRSLEEDIGRSAIDEALSGFLRAHRGGAAGSEDLLRRMGIDDAGFMQRPPVERGEVSGVKAGSYVRARLGDAMLRDVARRFADLDSEVRAVCWVAARDTPRFARLVEEYAHLESDPQVRERLLEWAKGQPSTA